METGAYLDVGDAQRQECVGGRSEHRHVGRHPLQVRAHRVVLKGELHAAQQAVAAVRDGAEGVGQLRRPGHLHPGLAHRHPELQTDTGAPYQHSQAAQV